MDYGQHLVTTLVCFVKAEGGMGLLSGGFCQGALGRGAYVLHPGWQGLQSLLRRVFVVSVKHIWQMRRQ